MGMSIPRLNFSGDFSSQEVVNPNNWMSSSNKSLSEMNNHSYVKQDYNMQDKQSITDEQYSGYGSKITDSFGQKKDKFSMENLPVINPAQLTSADRLSQRPNFDAGEGASPATVGDTISNMLEKVHEKTEAYEERTDAMLGKSSLSPLQLEKDALTSSNETLSFHHNKQENQKSDIERQIDTYMGVMKHSYEYYIFTSMTIDMGKGVSQTANNLTRG